MFHEDWYPWSIIAMGWRLRMYPMSDSYTTISGSEKPLVSLELPSHCHKVYHLNKVWSRIEQAPVLLAKLLVRRIWLTSQWGIEDKVVYMVVDLPKIDVQKACHHTIGNLNKMLITVKPYWKCEELCPCKKSSSISDVRFWSFLRSETWTHWRFPHLERKRRHL